MMPVALVDYRVQQRADIEGGCHPEHDHRAGAPLFYSAPPGYVPGPGVAEGGGEERRVVAGRVFTAGVR
jgi:hypothetical protein